jgi:hypothetical protein
MSKQFISIVKGMYFRSQTLTLEVLDSRLKLVENVTDTFKTGLDQIKTDIKKILNGFSTISTIGDDIKEVKANQIMNSTKIENLSWIVYINFATTIIILAFVSYFK